MKARPVIDRASSTTRTNRTTSTNPSNNDASTSARESRPVKPNTSPTKSLSRRSTTPSSTKQPCTQSTDQSNKQSTNPWLNSETKQSDHDNQSISQQSAPRRIRPSRDIDISSNQPNIPLNRSSSYETSQQPSDQTNQSYLHDDLADLSIEQTRNDSSLSQTPHNRLSSLSHASGHQYANQSIDRPVNQPTQSSLDRSSSPTSHDLLSFIDTLDQQTKRQERNLMAFKTSMQETINQTISQPLFHQTNSHNLSHSSPVTARNSYAHFSSPLVSQSATNSINQLLNQQSVGDQSSQQHVNQSINQQIQQPVKQSVSSELHALTDSSHADATFAKVRDKMLTLTDTVAQQKRTISQLEDENQSIKQSNKQSIDQLVSKHAAELETQKKQLIDRLNQQISFIDTLVKDKQSLSDQLEKMHTEQSTIQSKHEAAIAALQHSHNQAINQAIKSAESKAAERQAAWSKAETKRIKEMTVKGMENEVNRIVETMRKKLDEARVGHERVIAEIESRHLIEKDELRRALLVKHSVDMEQQQARFDASVRQRADSQSAMLSGAVTEAEDRARATAAKQQREFDEMFGRYKSHMTRQIEDLKVAHQEECNKAREDERQSCEREKQQSLMDVEQRFNERLRQVERQATERADSSVSDQLTSIVDRLTAEHVAEKKQSEQQHARELMMMKQELNSVKQQWQSEVEQSTKSTQFVQSSISNINNENEELQIRLRDKERALKERARELEVAQNELDAAMSQRNQLERDHKLRLDEQRRSLTSKLEIEQSQYAAELARRDEEYNRSIHRLRERVSSTISKKDDIIVGLEQEMASLQNLLGRQQHELRTLGS